MFEQLIPIFVIAGLIIYGLRQAYSKEKKNNPGGLGENFPFPKQQGQTHNPEKQIRTSYDDSEKYEIPKEIEYFSLETAGSLEMPGNSYRPIEFFSINESSTLESSVSLELDTINNIESTLFSEENQSDIEKDDLLFRNEIIDFDLRKAVIYSEILNPKYKNY